MKESVKKLLACDIEKYVDDGEDCGQDLIDVVIELRKVTQEPSLLERMAEGVNLAIESFYSRSETAHYQRIDNLKKLLAEYEQTKEG